MAANKAGSRRRQKPKVENLYKILGLRSNATQASIKQKYIEMVRQFPPETHPEQFQQIRRAYETLRDPVKRSEYDLLRKYGGKVENVLDEAAGYLEVGAWDKAASLLEQALQMSPRNISALFGLAQVAFMKDDMEMFDEQFLLAREYAPTDEEKAIIAGTKINLLIENDEAEKALAELDEISALFPQQADKFSVLYCKAYADLGRDTEALALAEALIPSANEQQPEHITDYVFWINILIGTERWNLWSKVQSRIKQFLRSITDEDDKKMVVGTLMYEYIQYLEVGRFREAQMFIELAGSLDSRRPEIKEGRRQTQKLVNMQREMERMEADRDMFPLIVMQALEWFYGPFWDEESLLEIREWIPPGMLGQLEMMNEEYAAGVLRLRKKYPLLYQEFKNSWDALFEEKAEGLNREARRRLK